MNGYFVCFVYFCYLHFFDDEDIEAIAKLYKENICISNLSNLLKLYNNLF